MANLTLLLTIVAVTFVNLCCSSPTEPTTTISSEEETPMGKSGVIFNEPDCSKQGGICVLENDCPSGYLTNVKGLCPKQKRMGVECCYSLPISAKTCKSRAGECVSKKDCGHAPIVTGGKELGCTTNQVCCVFLK